MRSPENLNAMARTDFVRELARYDGPVLVLNGERDRPARRGERAFRAASRRIRVDTVPGARHACNLDAPELFNAAVRSFAQTAVLR